MPYTYLQVINKTLQQAREIAGSQSLLVDFDDSARAARINAAREAWLSIVQEIFDLTEEPVPREVKTATITLVEGTAANSWGREYALPADCIMVRWPLIYETKGYVINEYPGGFEAMRKSQEQPRRFTGRPNYGCIEPVNGYLRVDTDPLAEDAGLGYTLYYDRYIKPYHEFDLMPFADNITDALLPCVVELYNRKMKQTFDDGIFSVNFARAIRQIGKNQVTDTW